MLKLIGKISFLFYFLFYAVSPLTVTIAHTAGADGTGAQEDCRELRALLPEILAEQVPANEEGTRKPGTDSIIVKKKRAIVPEEYAGRLTLKDSLSAPPVPDGALAAGFQPYCDRYPRTKRTSNGFFRLHAGHSPPRG